MLEGLSYHGVQFHQVEPGTKITDERTGLSEIVDNGKIVLAGGHCYMVEEDYRKLRDAPQIKNPRLF